MKIIITESQYRLLEQQISNYDLPKEKLPIKDKTNTYINLPLIVQQLRDYEEKKCSDIFNDKTLEDAKTWWVNWLNDPKTKKKMMISKGLDEKGIETLIKNYIKTLNIIGLSYCFKDCDESEGTFASVNRQTPYTIKIVCNRPVTGDKNTPISILIHEIQHSLNNMVEPLHSEDEINKIFKKPTSNDNETPNFDDLKNYGITGKGFDYWKFIWLHKDNPKIKTILDAPYTCDSNEMSSRIMSLRKDFNLKPGENITIKHILPFLNDPEKMMDGQLQMIFLCWVKNGLRDINDFLKDLNQLAVNNKKINTNVS